MLMGVPFQKDISNAGDSGHVEAFDVSWNTQKGVLASSITLRN